MLPVLATYNVHIVVRAPEGTKIPTVKDVTDEVESAIAELVFAIDDSIPEVNATGERADE